MISFDPKCANAHVFEGWFGTSADFESQRVRGLVACPFCDNAEIEKAVMAPAVGRKGNVRDTSARAPRVSTDQALDPAAAMLAQQRAFEARSQWVGGDFAETARTLHSEGSDKAIHGEASGAEVESLLEEGIPVLPMPFTPLAKGDA